MTLNVASSPSPIADARQMSAGATFLWVLVIRVLVVAAGLVTIHLSSPQIPLVWDEQSYLYILEHGYAPADDPHNLPYIAFFPLYPMMARPLAAFMPPHVALLVVSNVCSLIGFAFMFLWLRSVTSARITALSVLVLATSVNAVFFSRALTEASFFMWVAIGLWLMQKERLLAAAVVCGLATLTRPTGVALAITLALYALLQTTPAPWMQRLARAALVGLIGVSGALAYEGFLWHRYQRPDVYFTAQQVWQGVDENRIQANAEHHEPARYSLRFFLDRAVTPSAWNRLFALAILILIGIGFIWPGPMPRVLFVLPLVIFIMTALPHHGLRISSVVRYESPALPLFVLLGWWLSKVRRGWIVSGFLAMSLALQIFYAVLFCRSVWVG